MVTDDCTGMRRLEENMARQLSRHAEDTQFYTF